MEKMDCLNFQTPPDLTFDAIERIKEKIYDIVELSRPTAQAIHDKERLNNFLEHKIYSILNYIKIYVGGNARFFKIVKKLQIDLGWEDS